MRALGTCEYSATSSMRSLSRHHIMWARIGTCNCPPQLALGRGRRRAIFAPCHQRGVPVREYACTGDLRVFCDLQYAFPIEAPHHVGTNRYLQLPTPTSSGAGAAGALFSRLATKGVCQCASMRALGTCEYSATSSTRSLSRHHIMWARIGTCNCPPQLALGRGRPARCFRALPPKGCASARVCVHWGPALR